MSFNLIKKWNIKNHNFFLFQRGTGGGQGWEMHHDNFFVFAEQIVSWHLFFQFWNLQRYWTNLPKINLEDLVDSWVFLVPGRNEDVWLTATTCWRHVSEQKMHTIWLAIRLCPWDFKICPCPEDMVVGHFQLR